MAKVSDTPDNLKKCICPRCPTYTDCTRKKKEKFFCAKGETACPVVQKSCICGDCPIWYMFGLEKGYFCLHGKAQ